jgi:hypothetical protein
MQITKPSNYNHYTMDELNDFWEQVKTHIRIPRGPNPYNCIETDLALATSGRPQLRYRGDGKKRYISIMLCLRKYRMTRDPNYNIPVGGECSHLCHNKACINADWLTFEPGDHNKTRGCCEMFKHVNGYLCPHDPICNGCRGIPGHNVDDDMDEDVDDEDDDNILKFLGIPYFKRK